MTYDPKASPNRTIRNILLIIICITLAFGIWSILTDTTIDKISEAEKVIKEEQNIEK